MTSLLPSQQQTILQWLEAVCGNSSSACPNSNVGTPLHCASMWQLRGQVHIPCMQCSIQQTDLCRQNSIAVHAGHFCLWRWNISPQENQQKPLGAGQTQSHHPSGKLCFCNESNHLFPLIMNAFVSGNYVGCVFIWDNVNKLAPIVVCLMKLKIFSTTLVLMHCRARASSLDQWASAKLGQTM